MIKSRMMRWAGRVSQMQEKRNKCRVLMGKPKGKRQLGRTEVDGRKISKWILEKQDVSAWDGSIWLSKGTSGGPLRTLY
jgi:hypothetical protein